MNTSISDVSNAAHAGVSVTARRYPYYVSMTTTETLLRPDPEPNSAAALPFANAARRRPLAPTVVDADRQRWLLRGWIMLLAGAAVLEPLGDPEAASLWWHQLSSIAFALMLLPMLFSLFIRAPWGAQLSTLTALVAIPVAIGCGTSGHHETWWWYELIGTSALVMYGALSVFRPDRAAVELSS